MKASLPSASVVRQLRRATILILAFWTLAIAASVVWNVLFNAYEASPGGTTIVIQFEDKAVLPEALAVRLADNLASQYLCIRVTDGAAYDDAEAAIFENPLEASPESEGLVRDAATAGIVHDHEGAVRMIPAGKGRQIEIYLLV